MAGTCSRSRPRNQTLSLSQVSGSGLAHPPLPPRTTPRAPAPYVLLSPRFPLPLLSRRPSHTPTVSSGRAGLGQIEIFNQLPACLSLSISLAWALINHCCCAPTHSSSGHTITATAPLLFWWLWSLSDGYSLAI